MQLLLASLKRVVQVVYAHLACFSIYLYLFCDIFFYRLEIFLPYSILVPFYLLVLLFPFSKRSE